MPTANETEIKINGFENIALGWHFGEGVPADNYTVSIARSINIALRDIGFLKTDAFLGAGGQIQVNGYYEDLYLEFIIEDRLIYFLFEKNGQRVFEERDLDLINAISRIKFWGISWVTSEYSSLQISIVRKEDSLMHRFFTQAMGVSQLFIENALAKQGEVSANILENFTQQSLATPSFFSRSHQNIYQISASS